MVTPTGIEPMIHFNVFSLFYKISAIILISTFF
nr:MAG TPA: hypothetical protein [Caudoviricetes sp.]